MRLDWIDDLLAVLDTGSLARAAERRLLTQSAFTRRIRMIEDVIGARLFDRSRKPVVLLPGVAALEPELRRMSADLRRLQRDLRQTAERPGRGIAIACQHALTTTLSPKVVALLADDAGTVRMRSGNRDECLVQLLAGEADIAITYHVPGDPAPGRKGAFVSVPLGTDRLVPVCVPSMQDRATTGAIPVIAYPSEVFLGAVFDRRIAPRLPEGLTLIPRAETALTLAMIQLALDGVGAAWLPRTLVHDSLCDGRLVALSDTLPEQPLEVRMLRPSDAAESRGAAIWDRLTGAALF